MRFFKALNDYNLYYKYAEILDWLLSDGKFDVSIWDNKNKVQAFTKAFYKFERFSKEQSFHQSKKSLSFPCSGSYSQLYVPSIYMSAGESYARDLLRHIRNGIAHGNARVYDFENELLIELLDFGKESIYDNGQTAYMLLPLEYIEKIYELYCLKEKTWKRSMLKKTNKGKNEI